MAVTSGGNRQIASLVHANELNTFLSPEQILSDLGITREESK